MCRRPPLPSRYVHGCVRVLHPTKCCRDLITLQTQEISTLRSVQLHVETLEISLSDARPKGDAIFCLNDPVGGTMHAADISATSSADLPAKSSADLSTNEWTTATC